MFPFVVNKMSIRDAWVDANGHLHAKIELAIGGRPPITYGDVWLVDLTDYLGHPERIEQPPEPMPNA